jgi:50S ribosomal protein L16 3-hydroxylase
LLGGLSPAQFMRRHWQKKPLLVRQAWPGVQSRHLPQRRCSRWRRRRRGVAPGGRLRRRWTVRHGPFRARAAALKQPLDAAGAGLDLHLPAAHAMLDAFRFVPDARLDDLMISWASRRGRRRPACRRLRRLPAAGAGPRRWRIGPVADRALVDGLPLKILRTSSRARLGAGARRHALPAAAAGATTASPRASA